jgi:predicted GH43/DUF377 family glycosyl hydrolase
MVIKKLKSKIAIKKVKPSLKKKVVIKQEKTKKISLSSQKIRLVKVKKVISKNKKNISNKKIKILLKNKIVKNLKVKSQKKEIHIKLEKASHNPIISPSLYDWESKATFNPTAFENNGKVHLLYRAVGEDEISNLGYASSYDGLHIEDRPTYFAYKRFFEYKETGEKIDYFSGGGWCGGCEDPRAVLIDDIVYVIYTAFDGWGSVRLALTSILFSDFKKKKWNWSKSVMISPPGEINKNWVLFPEKINGKFAILHSFYPKILIDYFDDLNELDGKHFIKSNNTRPVDKTRTWDSWFRGVGPSPIKTKEGWLILYHAMDHNNPDRYRLGALILDINDPTKVLYRSQKPILEPEEDYENNGHKWGVVYSCGAVVKDGELFVYYGGADKFVCVASIDLEDLLEDLKKDKKVKLLKNKIIK